LQTLLLFQFIVQQVVVYNHYLHYVIKHLRDNFREIAIITTL